MPPAKSTSRRSDQLAENSNITRPTSPALGGSSSRPKGKRGPSRTSCAECRRLKLKCDGKVPCYQCVKRGYTAICPEGSLTTGQGHRLFWNTTTDNRVKLSGYKDRIAQLEEALRSSHSVVSNDPHPLLSEDHLRIKDHGTSLTSTTTVERQSTPSDGRASPDNEVFDRFGSLSLTANGGSRFFGHAANSWILMDNDENDPEEDYTPTIGLYQILPPELLMQTGISLPDMMGRPYPMTREDELQLLVDLLPSEEEANKLNTNSYRYGFFSWQPIPLDEYRSNIFEPLYKQQPQLDHPLFAVRLAVMYTMLAHGAQLSPELRLNGPEAERYHHLSRAALVHARLMHSPTVEGIQALFLMSLYLSFSDTASRDTSNVRWCITGFMMKLCQITGLQSDPNRYGFSPAEIKRRTLLFSEIYMYDLSQALMYSRPPAIAVGYFDVKPYSDEGMGPETHYHIWKYKFGVECLGPVHAQAYSATPPTYSTVLNLARRVEDYPAFTPPDNEEERKRPDHPVRMMQARTSRGHKEDVLLHMHRPFCILATEKYKDDPLKSEYGSSVIAAYRSAHRLISYGDLSYKEAEHPINRAWLMWARVYDAAIVLGTLAIRCPHLSFATDAYNQLRVACTMFHHAREALEAENVYEKLMKTLDLAHESISAFAAGTTDAGNNCEAEALLAKLGTKPIQTKRLETRAGSHKSYASSHSSWSPFEDPVVPLNIPSSATSTKYHPNVLEYFSSHSDSLQGLTLPPIQTEWGMPADHSVDGFIPCGMVAPADFETPSTASFGGPPSAEAYHSAISRNPTELRADVIAYPTTGSISGFRRRDAATVKSLPDFNLPLDPMNPSGAAYPQFADVPSSMGGHSSFTIGPGMGYQAQPQYASGSMHPAEHRQNNHPLPLHPQRYSQPSQVSNPPAPTWTGQYTPHMYPTR